MSETLTVEPALASRTVRTVPAAADSIATQSWHFLRDPVPYIAELTQRHGPVVKLRIVGLGELVAVTRSDLVQRVLTDRATFENYSGDEILAPVIGPDGLILLTGEMHLRRRKLLLPPFHGERLSRWANVISSIAERELDRVPRELPLSIRPTMARITAEVICQVVFGVEDPAKLDRLCQAIARWSNPRFALPLLVPQLRLDLGPHSPWGGFLRARAEMRELLEQAISDATNHPDRASRDDVLTMMLAATDENGNPGYTHEELHNELLTLLFAGHDTTASALAWSCVFLARHPPAWQRLVIETNGGDTDFTDAIGKETLRLRPSVVSAGRYALRDTELGGYAISAGTRLGTLTVAGYDADNFADPSAFKPERWLGDKQPSNYASTPFGGGVHRCIGASLATLESRLVLQQLARAAQHLHPAPGRPDTHTSYSAVLVPSRGGRVIIGARRVPQAPSVTRLHHDPPRR